MVAMFLRFHTTFHVFRAVTLSIAVLAMHLTTVNADQSGDNHHVLSDPDCKYEFQVPATLPITDRSRPRKWLFRDENAELDVRCESIGDIGWQPDPANNELFCAGRLDDDDAKDLFCSSNFDGDPSPFVMSGVSTFVDYVVINVSIIWQEHDGAYTISYRRAEDKDGLVQRIGAMTFAKQIYESRKLKADINALSVRIDNCPWEFNGFFEPDSVLQARVNKALNLLTFRTEGNLSLLACSSSDEKLSIPNFSTSEFTGYYDAIHQCLYSSRTCAKRICNQHPQVVSVATLDVRGYLEEMMETYVFSPDLEHYLYHQFSFISTSSTKFDIQEADFRAVRNVFNTMPALDNDCATDWSCVGDGPCHVNVEGLGQRSLPDLLAKVD